MAGLFSLGADYPRAIRTLEAVYASGAEVADDRFLQRYLPVKSFPVETIGGGETNVAVSRELLRMRLATLYMVTGNLDQASRMAAEVINAGVAAELHRKIAARRNAG